ncbi:MAG: hypothetical protein M1482_12920, partial [Chloroflexi bacterium]|nr:hypothetical protein [Chloroflexota bacterium]
MTTGNPGRDARISIIGLTALAVVGMAGAWYSIDRLIVDGAVTRKVADACQAVASACGAAVSPVVSYLPGARTLLAALSLAALVFAIVKAA